MKDPVLFLMLILAFPVRPVWAGEPVLEKVTAVSEKMAARKQRRWLSLGDGQLGHDGARTVMAYGSAFHLPADGVRLRFPETNSMVRASVQSRPDEKSPWVSRCSALFYALRMDGAEMKNQVEPRPLNLAGRLRSRSLSPETQLPSPWPSAAAESGMKRLSLQPT